MDTDYHTSQPTSIKLECLPMVWKHLSSRYKFCFIQHMGTLHHPMEWWCIYYGHGNSTPLIPKNVHYRTPWQCHITDMYWSVYFECIACKQKEYYFERHFSKIKDVDWNMSNNDRTKYYSVLCVHLGRYCQNRSLLRWSKEQTLTRFNHHISISVGYM